MNVEELCRYVEEAEKTYNDMLYDSDYINDILKTLCCEDESKND